MRIETIKSYFENQKLRGVVILGRFVLINGSARFRDLAFQLDSAGGVIDDFTTNRKGLRYAGNYSSTFVARSLVDKAYVDSVAANSLTDGNATTASGSSVNLGGTATASGIIYSNSPTVSGLTSGQSYEIYTVSESILTGYYGDIQLVNFNTL